MAKTGPKPRDPLVRFWEKVEKKGMEECWLWTGSINSSGYGHIVIGSRTTGRRTVRAHRMSYEIHTGRLVPAEFDICHSCDNPPCVNPFHLFQGTRLENMRDAYVKGRTRKPSNGAICRNGHSKTGPNVKIVNGLQKCAECLRNNSKHFYWNNPEKERARKRDIYNRQRSAS